jgi:hypothetical protein
MGDEQAIARLVHADSAQVAIEIITLAFLHAKDGFLQSGVRPWIQRDYLPPPDRELRARIGNHFLAFYWKVYFALRWTKTLTTLSSELRPKLRKLLSDQGSIWWNLRWIEWGSATHTLGYSQ